MPTYEYRCAHCGVFEKQQPITDAALKECPSCGGPVQRLISRNVGIIYKGSGFHVTDYPSSSRGKAEEEGAEAKDTAAKESKKEESATAKTAKEESSTSAAS